MKLEQAQKIVFVGDSITDSGRSQPIGEGLFGALGNGWVSFVDGLLNASQPELRPRVVNMGTSGNTSRDMAARWDRDGLDLKPDWVSIMVGVNDVWRQFDMPTVPEASVELSEYEATLRSLVERTIPKVKGVVLMTPFFLELNPDDAMRRTLDTYGNAVCKIAIDYRCVLVDAQAAMDEFLQHYHPSFIGWDRVHVNTTGNMVLALAWLNAMGVNLN